MLDQVLNTLKTIRQKFSNDDEYMSEVFGYVNTLDEETLCDLIDHAAEQTEAGSDDIIMNRLAAVLAEPQSGEFASLDKETKYSVFSTQNLREDYAFRFATVTMTSYLMRCIEEYKTPEGHKVVSLEDYMRDPAAATALAPEIAATATEEWLAERKASIDLMQQRLWTYEFLKSQLEFNPAVHASGSYTPLVDPTTKTIMTPQAQWSARYFARQAKAYSRPTAETAEAALKHGEALGYTKLNSDKMNRDYINNTVNDYITKTVRDRHGRKKTIRIRRKNGETSVDPDARARAEQHIMPQDTFVKLYRYRDANFTQLHGVTHDLHAQRDGADQQLFIYGTFDTADEAEQYVQDNQSSFKYPVMTIEHGNWAFIAKSPDDQTKIIGKDGALARSLLAQQEAVNRAGKHLSDNRARQARRQMKTKTKSATISDDHKEILDDKIAEQAGLTAASRDEDEERGLFTTPLHVMGADGVLRTESILTEENPVEVLTKAAEQVHAKTGADFTPSDRF